MQQILKTIRRGIFDYNMIEPNDKIAVGLSGGKDSMVLLDALYRIKQFSDIPFDIQAITVDPMFGGKNGDYSAIEEYCNQRDIPYTIRPSELATIIFEVRKEKNPCSLCSRMRRGIINGVAKDNGCNKLALGHHQDDIIETFMLNLFREGRLGCFQPVTYLSRRDITVIRPMMYLTETKVESAAQRYNLPIVKSLCPVDKETARQDMKELILKIEYDYHYRDLRKNIFGAIKKSELNGW